jgi:hypothetical protein
LVHLGPEAGILLRDLAEMVGGAEGVHGPMPLWRLSGRSG